MEGAFALCKELAEAVARAAKVAKHNPHQARLLGERVLCVAEALNMKRAQNCKGIKEGAKGSAKEGVCACCIEELRNVLESALDILSFGDVQAFLAKVFRGGNNNEHFDEVHRRLDRALQHLHSSGAVFVDMSDLEAKKQKAQKEDQQVWEALWRELRAQRFDAILKMLGLDSLDMLHSPHATMQRKALYACLRSYSTCADCATAATAPGTANVSTSVQSASAAPLTLSHTANPLPAWHLTEAAIKSITYALDSKGNYVELGGGEYHRTYKATFAGQSVAVTMLTRDGFRSLQRVRSMQQEIDRLYRLHHPNLARLYGASLLSSSEARVDGSCPLLVAEWPPTTLHRALYHEHLLEDDYALKMRMASGIASALQYLHSAQPPIVHQDVNPHKIMLTRSLTPKLMDAGLTSIVMHTLGSTRALVDHGQSLGTPGYISPETLNSDPTYQLSPSGNVFAFGVVLWQLIYEWEPFPNMRDTEINAFILAGRRPPLPVHSGLSVLVAACWSADVAQRPDMSQVVRCLRACTHADIDSQRMQQLLQPPPAAHACSACVASHPSDSELSTPLGTEDDVEPTQEGHEHLEEEKGIEDSYVEHWFETPADDQADHCKGDQMMDKLPTVSAAKPCSPVYDMPSREPIYGEIDQFSQGATTHASPATSALRHHRGENHPTESNATKLPDLPSQPPRQESASSLFEAGASPSVNVSVQDIPNLIALVSTSAVSPTAVAEGLEQLGQLCWSQHLTTQVMDLGGIPAVVQAMSQFLSEPQVQYCGCWILTNIVLSEDRQQRVAEANGIEAVVLAMQTHPMVQKVQHIGCWALAHLAAHHKHQARLLRAHAVDAVVQAMRAFPAHAHVQQYSCQFLFDMTKGSSTTDGIEMSENLQEHVKANNDSAKETNTLSQASAIIEVLLAAMYALPLHDKVQGRSLGALQNLVTQDPSQAQSVLASGGAQMVVKGLVNHATNVEVQRRGCWLLINLAVSDQGKDAVVKAGGVAAVVSTLRRYDLTSHQEHQACIHRFACWALEMLAGDYESNNPHLHHYRLLIAQAGGVAAIVGTMKQYATVSDLQDRACAALCNLAANKSTRAYLIQEGALPAIVAAMRNHTPLSSIQQAGCAVFECIASDPAYKELAAQAGAIEAVVSAMRFPQHVTNAHLQEYGCRALLGIGRLYSTNKVAFTTAGGMEAVIGAMRTHGELLLMQNYGCWVLGNAAMEAANALLIVELGGAETLVSAMLSYPADQNLQSNGCRTLLNLVLNPQCQVPVARAGGFEAIVSAMHDFPDCEYLQDKGCRALVSLGEQDMDNKVCLAGAGGFDVIARAMRAFPDNVNIQQFGCESFARVACNADLKGIAAAVGGLQAVVNAMRHHILTVEVQENGCWALDTVCSLDCNKQPAAKAGAIRAIVQAMVTHRLSLKVQSLGCSALTHMASGNTKPERDLLIDVMAREGGVESILTAMRSYMGSGDMQARGCEALKVLCANAKVCLLLVDLDGVNVVHYAMTTYPSLVDVQVWVIGILLNMACQEKTRAALVEGKAIQAILGAMQAHPEHADVQYYGCWALTIITADNQCYQKMVVELGGLELVTKAVEMNTTHKGIQRYGKMAKTSIEGLKEPPPVAAAIDR